MILINTETIYVKIEKEKRSRDQREVITTGGWIRQQPHKVQTKLKIKLFFSV
jgi:hypothetical protein